MANEFKVKRGLIVAGSGSATPIVDVQGSQGQLFSITDSLSGSLFSANDISGIPVIEAFSDTTVKMGQFNAEALIVSGSEVRMGNRASNNHSITGSLRVTGSTSINGTTNVTGALNVSSTAFVDGQLTVDNNIRLTGNAATYVYLPDGGSVANFSTGNTRIEFASSSMQIVSNGSNEMSILSTGVRIGNVVGDIHTVTGSLIVSGSTLSQNGSNVVLTNQTSSFTLNSATGSLVRVNQTSSMSVLSSSYAATSSFAGNLTVASLLSIPTATSTTGLNIVSSAPNGGGSVIRLSRSNATTNQAYMSIESDQLYLGVAANDNSNGYIGTKGSVDMAFQTNYTTRMTINSSGNVTSTVDFRAPIFYDTNNTAYYLDPASTSYLYRLTLSPGTSGVTTGLYVNGGDITAARTSNTGVIYFGTGGSVYLYYDGSNYLFGGGGGYTQNDASFRAPIFYDSADTGYYVDPASTSNLNVLNILGQKTLSVMGGNTITGNINAVWGLVKLAGNKIYFDEQFNDGSNSVNVYNNAGGSAVTITRKNSSFLDSNVSPMPNSSGYVLEIKHAPGESSGITPGYGGFYFATTTSPGSRRLVCIFKMKVPSGRTIEFATNSIGTNGTSGWLTSNAGTGQYQDYAYLVHSGTASFSSTMFFYISGGASSTFYTYLASATVYDVTNVSDDVMRTYTAGAAMYAPIYYDSNDTNYYVNPASTSNLSVANIVNYYVGNAIYFGGGNYYLNWTNSRIYSNVNFEAANIYSSVFYDSADTAYFFDGNSTSRMYQARFQSRISVGDGNGTPYLNTGSPGVWLSYNGGSDIFMGAQTSTLWGVYIGDGWEFTVSNAGTATATGDVVAYSDARVKENIKTIDNALEKVLLLRGVSYNRTDTEDKSDKIGVIAQETQPIVPEVVHEQENGMLGVAYGNFAGLFIEAFKEQQTIITSQQQQIDELKELVNKLLNK